uniref:Ig-like domain-containing protein n=1 Tax=Haplochromis burtoni TaxID=8153 RepID=A0A3Q2VX91_HAPBU
MRELPASVLLFHLLFFLNEASKKMSFSLSVPVLSCVFMEKCILPCTFQSDTDIVIHWLQETAGNIRVHSFYHNQDQPALQDKHFRSRTSLFNNQISRGNASLLLMWVQDEGRYSCYISTINTEKDSFINLKVHSMTNLSIQHVGNRITCSSEGIYPKPELTWSTRPPSKVSFKNTTTVEQTKQQLYNINGSLIASLNESDRVYKKSTKAQEINNSSINLHEPLLINQVLLFTYKITNKVKIQRYRFNLLESFNECIQELCPLFSYFVRRVDLKHLKRNDSN